MNGRSEVNVSKESDPRWQWTFTPQIVVSGMNFVVVLLGVIGLWFKLQHDVQQVKDDGTELKKAVMEMTKVLVNLTERVVKVETQVQTVLPTVQRIEDRQLRTLEPMPGPGRR